MFYSVHQFIVHRQEKDWQVHHIETGYRNLGQTGVLWAVERAGLDDARWIEPVASGDYQRILLARRPESWQGLYDIRKQTQASLRHSSHHMGRTSTRYRGDTGTRKQ